MKIAILGARGFVGSSLTNYLSTQYTVIPIFRQTLDLLNFQAVTNFLKEHKFDVIINAAAVMTDAENIKDTRNNLGIYMNFFNNSDLFDKFINLASGAEYDRSINIDCIDEIEIFNRLPKDSYGFGQNIKSRLSYNKDNFYNIRIFNCFGVGEYETRIFKKYLTQGFIDISNDRYFDYFSIDDLCLLVNDCIKHDWNIKDVNAVYEKKITISQAIKTFCLVNNIEPKINIVSTSSNNYTGNSSQIEKIGLKFAGLEQGFLTYYEKGLK